MKQLLTEGPGENVNTLTNTHLIDICTSLRYGKRISLRSSSMKTDGRQGTRGEEKVQWGLAWHLQAPSSELYFLLSAPA